jgi:hypothetical protein
MRWTRASFFFIRGYPTGPRAARDTMSFYSIKSNSRDTYAEASCELCLVLLERSNVHFTLHDSEEVEDTVRDYTITCSKL